MDAAAVDGRDRGVEIRVAGEQDPADRLVAVGHPSQQIHPAHAGHPLVGDHEGEVAGQEGLPGLVPGQRLGDPGLPAQGAGEQLDGAGLVVDDEDVGLPGRHRF